MYIVKYSFLKIVMYGTRRTKYRNDKRLPVGIRLVCSLYADVCLMGHWWQNLFSFFPFPP